MACKPAAFPELSYVNNGSPFDLAGPMTVSAGNGVPAAEAVLLEIKRHVHSKAVNAVKDADARAVHASSIDDYPLFSEIRHKAALKVHSISFDTMPTPPLLAATPAAARTVVFECVSSACFKPITVSRARHSVVMVRRRPCTRTRHSGKRSPASIGAEPTSSRRDHRGGRRRQNRRHRHRT
ncbi:hypothetical protein RCH23_002019 [Cryobacterium sp. CAN_C3]|uniref:hypothetical protein n=1 Tax=unclassified Cryobacterium TaxID=2649013 RepID=UPI0018C98E94|nr:hypothetical protein [Cryobacterium sp. CAN_C3]MEC5154635.1 hypothetical protein [Cryobacterium sp. CAN_C3]